MEHTKIIVAGAVLLVLVGGMFTYTHLKKKELLQNQEIPTATSSVQENQYEDITRINAKHFYDGKTHTIVGDISLPTPCDLLNWNPRVQESMPETAIVDFTVVNHSNSCVQTVTQQQFRVSFDASKDATIKATFQGRPVELNLIPGAPNETPDDFEIFSKG